MGRTFKMGGEEFEIYDSRAVAASKGLAHFYNKLGKPDDPFSKQGHIMMELIIAAWEDLYPEQRIAWIKNKELYQDTEMSTKEQAHKGTGRSLASIPTPIYQMMKRVFPEFKMDNREDFIKLVQKYPVFQMTNKI